MAFTTRKSLIARLKNHEEASWNEFYATYKPLVILCGQDCGLLGDELDELVQLVMCEIFQKDILGKYAPDQVPADVVFRHDPARGRFRHYLRGIIRNQARKLYRKRDRHLVPLDETTPEPLSDEQFETAYDDAWHTHLLTQAMLELRNQVQTETFAAFDLYALQNRPPQEVAQFLNLSINSVYVAKSRCISSLKQIISNLEADNQP